MGIRSLRACLTLCLTLCLALCLAGLLVACGPAPAPPRPTIGVENRTPTIAASPLALHVLNRLAYGPDADSVVEIEAKGVDGWIDEQLHPERIAEPTVLLKRLAELQSIDLDVPALFARYRQLSAVERAANPVAAKLNNERMKGVLEESRAAHLYRALYSHRQLQEVMVDFWFNHFNVYGEKFLDRLWVGNYADVAIRPHVLGHFRDLLEATARHPAMLYYLDNVQNTAPGSAGARSPEDGINENYAREVMELHTLGIDGGYSQGDVTTLARILTGWGNANPQPRSTPRRPLVMGDNGFSFDPSRHDFSDKILLGHHIAGGGSREVDTALDLLADSPATAHHLSFQLAQYFVADEPPPALVDGLTAVWLETHGDIAAVMKKLLNSADFRSPATFGSKFKTPQMFLISAVRATGIAVNTPRPLLATLNRLGQPVFGSLTPDGYKNTREPWLNSDSLNIRLNVATALGSGQMATNLARSEAPLLPTSLEAPALSPPAKIGPLNPTPIALVLGPRLTGKTRDVVTASEPALKAAVLLGSPDFMAR